ncbi:MAG: porin family protein [Myxococcales bacterium]|nr:porin family protein [Myxococcales bacterium]
MKPKFLCPLLPLAAILVMGSASVANAQPGMTPPGTTPPHSDPPPASPGPAGPPPAAPASAYAPAPYYGPPMPPPAQPKERSGFHIGLSGGGGSMTSDAGEFTCNGCNYAAGTFDLHAGRMLSPKFALQGELWCQIRSLNEDGHASITQTMYMIAAQYWLHPRFWVKAGIGGANLSLSYESDFGEQERESLDDGTSMQFAIGFEVIHSHGFSLDTQIKTGFGSYSDRDEKVSATSLNLGLNWY